jgi:hypothetical protein
MAESIVSHTVPVSLAEAASLISTVRGNRFLLEGEPGIGKSSILKTIGELTGLPTVYVDVPNLDLGDIAMPVVDHQTRTTKYYPNSRFGLHEGKPVCMMLDEFPKGADPVKNMLHPLLEVVNPRLGDLPIHPESIIFLTGNLSTDGVGDSVKAHTSMRLSRATVRKSTADEWVDWSIAKGTIAPEVTTCVSKNPQLMASYLDPSEQGNEFIYNPKRQSGSYVTGRTLELASNIVKMRDKFTPNAMLAALAGTLGMPGALLLKRFIDYADQLPEWRTIIADPEHASVPTSPGACSIVVFGAIQRIDKDTLGPFMKYLQRLPQEWQAAFAINLAKNPQRQAIAFRSAAFAAWISKNEDLL